MSRLDTVKVVGASILGNLEKAGFEAWKLPLQCVQFQKWWLYYILHSNFKNQIKLKKKQKKPRHIQFCKHVFIKYSYSSIYLEIQKFMCLMNKYFQQRRSSVTTLIQDRRCIIIVMFGLFLICGFREDSKYIFLVIFIGQISIINTLTISQNIPENMSSN